MKSYNNAELFLNVNLSYIVPANHLYIDFTSVTVGFDLNLGIGSQNVRINGPLIYCTNRLAKFIGLGDINILRIDTMVPHEMLNKAT